MGQPHKHAEVIKAWADGAEIQVRSTPVSPWVDTDNPPFIECFEYRTKPQQISVLRHVSFNSRQDLTKTFALDAEKCNIKFIFDRDGKLLDAEVLK